MRVRRSAFTLIELLVVIAIIAILASMLFPSFARAREMARRTACISNMKQIGLGIMQYTQDYDERLPNSVDGTPGQGKEGGWMFYSSFPGNDTAGSFQPARGSIYPYVKSVQIFVCPSDSVGQNSGDSYAANACNFSNTGNADNLRAGKSMVAFDDSTQWMMLTEESADNSNRSSTDDAYLTLTNNISPRHMDGASVLFMDGHAKWQRTNRMRSPYNIQTGGIDTTTCP